MDREQGLNERDMNGSVKINEKKIAEKAIEEPVEMAKCTGSIAESYL